MTHQQLVDYFFEKIGVEESFPFGPEARVFKVGGKMFGIIGEQDSPPRVNLKCEPDEAMALRDIFEGVIPGYHMNKRHWNTVIMQSDVPDGEIQRMIDNSYQLIVGSLTKKQQKLLKD